MYEPHLLGTAEPIRPRKRIQTAARTRIVRAESFARSILDRYLLRSEYGFRPDPFVFAGWSQGAQDPEERRLERELLLILRYVRESRQEKQMPAVYKQLLRQLERTVTVYEAQPGEGSDQLLALCRDVLEQKSRAADYLEEPRQRQRMEHAMARSVDRLAEHRPARIFTGRFRPALEDGVRGAAQMPGYEERFRDVKRRSAQLLHDVLTKRQPMIWSMESLGPEEKRQLQELFPDVFPAGKEPVAVLTSMPQTRWREWERQVVRLLAAPVRSSVPGQAGAALQPSAPGQAGAALRSSTPEQTGGSPLPPASEVPAALPLSSPSLDPPRSFGERPLDPLTADPLAVVDPEHTWEQLAGKLAFLSVAAEDGQRGQAAEKLLAENGEGWEKVERAFAELSGGEGSGKEIGQLWQVYTDHKKRLFQQLKEERAEGLLSERLTALWAEVLLDPGETPWKERGGDRTGAVRAQEKDVPALPGTSGSLPWIWYVREKERYIQKVLEQNGEIPPGMDAVIGKEPLLLLLKRTEGASGQLEELMQEIPELKPYTDGLSAETDRQERKDYIREVIASLDADGWDLLESRILMKAQEGQTAADSGRMGPDRQVVLPDGGETDGDAARQDKDPAMALAVERLARILTVSRWIDREGQTQGQMSAMSEERLPDRLPAMSAERLADLPPAMSAERLAAPLSSMLAERLTDPLQTWELVKRDLLHRREQGERAEGRVVKAAGSGEADRLDRSYEEQVRQLSETIGQDREKLVLILRDLMKEAGFERLAEQALRQGHRLPQQWEQLSPEQKLLQIWGTEPGAGVLRSDQASLPLHLEQAPSPLHPGSVPAPSPQAPSRTAPQAETGRGPLQEGQSALDVQQKKEKDKAREAVWERIWQTFTKEQAWADLGQEYRREKERYRQRVLEQNGQIPEGMGPVIGKAPLLFMAERQGETARRLEELLYEIPELAMYRRGHPAGEDRKEKEAYIHEVIVSLDAGQWRILEQRILDKGGTYPAEKPPGTGRDAKSGGLEQKNVSVRTAAPTARTAGQGPIADAAFTGLPGAPGIARRAASAENGQGSFPSPPGAKVMEFLHVLTQVHHDGERRIRPGMQAAPSEATLLPGMQAGSGAAPGASVGVGTAPGAPAVGGTVPGALAAVGPPPGTAPAMGTRPGTAAAAGPPQDVTVAAGPRPGDLTIARASMSAVPMMGAAGASTATGSQPGTAPAMGTRPGTAAPAGTGAAWAMPGQAAGDGLPVTMHHIIKSVCNEYGKLGKLVSMEEFERFGIR